MATPTSPLRYPGGKLCLLDLASSILRLNGLERGHYAEPFAGGCGLALALLYGGHVADIHINDIDPLIWSFWKSVLDTPDDLIEKINETPVTVEEWRTQREIQLHPESHNTLSLGFAAFFLNRTSRSGIISGSGIIGGYNQTGNYKIDCRYNIDNLSHRIRRIGKYRDRIHLYNMDAQNFIKAMGTELPEDTFFCIDPPYYKKGAELYMSFYTNDDHAGLAADVIALDRPWIVTYDNVPEIQDLYKERRQYQFDINYSVQTKRVGTEILIASKDLLLPKHLTDRLVNAPEPCSATFYKWRP
ncbi:DNA adenine methylase [Novispirillum itersonii]|uniref:DNA adenine methylase n=1 Tax=Novispirillum itersonii TaxID=189 RepID=UPI00035CA254|nr:DNA adenine methylase [Novispirillum itersonii]